MLEVLAPCVDLSVFWCAFGLCVTKCHMRCLYHLLTISEVVEDKVVCKEVDCNRVMQFCIMSNFHKMLSGFLTFLLIFSFINHSTSANNVGANSNCWCEYAFMAEPIEDATCPKLLEGYDVIVCAVHITGALSKDQMVFLQHAEPVCVRVCFSVAGGL